MKYIYITLILCSGFNTISQNRIAPISDLMKTKWELAHEIKGELPAVSGQSIFLSEKHSINAVTAKKEELKVIRPVSHPFYIYDSEVQLKIYDLNSHQQILNKVRKRARYIEIVGNNVYLTDDTILYEVDYERNIEAINILNNNKIWSTHSSSPILFKPVVFGDNLFAVTLDKISIINKKNGNLISQISTGGQVLSKLILDENKLYYIVKDIGLIAYNLESLKVEWTFELERYSGQMNKILIEDDTIYLADINLYAINNKDGGLIWKLGKEDGLFIRRPDLLSIFREYLIFYAFDDYETDLTVADKITGKILYQGSNSSIVGGDRNNSDGVAKEDLFRIKFMDEMIDNNILIGVLDDKIYGFELMK